MDALTFVSNLIDAVAWSIVVLLLVALFRPALVQLVPLLRKLKVRDVEFKFAETLESAKSAKVYHAVSGGAIPLDELSAKVDKLKRLLTSDTTRAEQLIIVLFYYEGQTDAQIAATLGLSEGRVREMRTAVIERLKANLAGT